MSVGDLLNDHRSKGVAVDSGLLILYYVGLTDESRIESYKRTSSYSAKDYHLLVRLLHQFRYRATTPNIMTEVSNLAGALVGNVRDELFSKLALDVREVSEKYFPTEHLGEDPESARLGLADWSLMSLARDGMLVLTSDLDLYLSCQRSGLAAVNFNHLRPLSWV